jgi:anti-sigma factor RsiW
MHLTDEQLNEYLDNESDESAQIETHLSSCDDCAARLTALQAIFTEIESLTELELTHSLAAGFNPNPNLVPRLPRWLTLTATLQTVLAGIAIILVAPFVDQWIAPFSQPYTVPFLADVWIDLQLTIAVWIQTFQGIPMPKLPSNLLTLPAGFTPAILSVSVIGMLLAWAFGNWWLLHKKTNSLA